MRRPASERVAGQVSDAPRDPAVHAFTAEAMARVHAILAEQWDGDHALRRAAAGRRDRDPAAPRALDDFTAIVCGILAAGGTKANVVDYLRGEEVALLGGVRSTPRALGDVARQAWLAVRGG